MPITDWPADERPREKLLARGAAALTDAELLAIFLRTGSAGRTALDLARELLARFGGLRALLRTRREDFCAVHGLGEAKYAQLQAGLELARRHLAEALAGREALKDPSAVRRLLQARLRDREHETFAALFLDNQPSSADRTLTERLKSALAQVDIRVLDHFVVGEQVVSFAERGWL